MNKLVVIVLLLLSLSSLIESNHLHGDRKKKKKNHHRKPTSRPTSEPTTQPTSIIRPILPSSPTAQPTWTVGAGAYCKVDQKCESGICRGGCCCKPNTKLKCKQCRCGDWEFKKNPGGQCIKN